ncbi:MAG: insulinase family protein [Planctomycetota bacterium]|nr:MAG: insulinase family protein [Planctomycetota bacterium]
MISPMLRCAAILVCWTMCTVVQAQSVHREVLANGVTVINVDRRDTHAAHIMVLVQAGQEHEGSLSGTGISRVLQGIIVDTARSHSDRLARLGGQLTTISSDFSGDHHGSPMVGLALTTTDSALSEGLHFLARALRQPQIDEQRLARSLQLIRSGEQRDAADPDTILQRNVVSLALREHPLRLPARGIPQLRQNLTVEMLADYHRQHYTGNRTTVIVVGNIDSARTRREVRRAFADLPQGALNHSSPIQEPVQFAPRHREVAAPRDEQRQIYGWRTPSLSFYHDHAALEVLQVLLQEQLEALSSGPDGQRLASSLKVRHFAPPRAPGLFTISLSPESQSSSDAWIAVQTALNDLRQNGPQDSQLQRAKRIWQRQQAERLSTVAGLAADLARWEQAVGAPEFGQQFRRSVSQLSIADIQRVAGTLLHPNGANVSRVSLRPATSIDPPAAGERSTLTDIAPRSQVLSGGVQLLHRYMPIGLTHVRITMRAGPSVEPEDLRGASLLLASLYQQGSEQLHGSDLTQHLSSLGMRLQSRATAHHLELHITCFPEDLEEALRILTTILAQPQLPQSAVEQVIARTISQSRRVPRSWSDRLLNAVDGIMLEQHYGLNDSGQLRESLESISRNDLLHWHRQITVGNNIVVSVYGDYRHEDLPTFINQQLAAVSGLEDGSSPQPHITDWSDSDPAAVTTLTAENDEEAIAWTWRAPDRVTRQDQPAMDVLIALLTGNQGQGGRLGRTLSDSGIDPDSALLVHRRSLHGRGYWSVLVQVPKGSSEDVRDRIPAEVQRLVQALTSSDSEHQENLSASEIEAAKSLVINARLIAMEDQGQASLAHAQALLSNDSIEGERDYHRRLEAVSRADLAGVANAYLDTTPIIVQIVPPQAENDENEESRMDGPDNGQEEGLGNPASDNPASD